MRKERGPRNPRAGMKQTRFSCTPEEYQIIQKEAEHAKMSINEYVRKRALGKPIINADKWLILAQLRAIHKDLWGWRHEQGVTLDFPIYAEFSRIRNELRKALTDLALSMSQEGGEENVNNQENGITRGAGAEQ